MFNWMFEFFLCLEAAIGAVADDKISTRIVGVVHHIPAITASYFVLSNNDFWTEPIHHTTPLSRLLIRWSFSYFLFDTAVLLKYHWKAPQHQLSYFIHAVLCCLTYCYFDFVGKYHFYGAAFLTWETSSPFLYISWFLLRNRQQSSIAYMVNAFMFFVTFFVFRVCIGSYIVYAMLFPQLSWICKVGAVTLTSLNYYWFTKALSKVWYAQI